MKTLPNRNQTTNTHPKAGEGPIDPSERGVDRSGATIIKRADLIISLEN
jgi:hypothetical protein